MTTRGQTRFGRVRMRLGIAKALLSQNGLRWVCYQAFLQMLHRLTRIMDSRLKTLEARYNLRGAYSTAWNQIIWSHYDWAQQGDEWSPLPGWKESITDDVLLKHVRLTDNILEIGPGAGRWTQILQAMAKHLVVVDISTKCIEECRKRFSTCDNIDYFVNDGMNLDFVQDASIDFIWSWDVFVHIDSPATEKYISEFARVLRKGGCGVVHHPKDGCAYGGWRSAMTAALFAELIRKYGLAVTSQFDSWGPEGRYGVQKYHDIITAFEK
jgi:ubiquinone/menaquinone biosynthesis C-methylase UbiE